MTDFNVEIVVIGAGVIGLAIARTLTQLGKEVLILEEEQKFGQITSSRNSGVIHAGIYYPKDSFKLIPGIEINCLLLGCLVHVIGLGINIKSKHLTPYIQGESPIGNDLYIKSVTNAIRLSGGLSFLAHPARYRIPFYKLIPEANKQGVDGIEVWYDYELKERWQASNFICSEINKLTESLKMLKSCGTDSHGYSLLGR